MKALKFGYIHTVDFSEYFSAKYRSAMELKELPSPVGTIFQAIEQVRAEKIKAISNGEKPFFDISKVEYFRYPQIKPISYDVLAVELAKLGQTFLKNQVDLTVGVGKPLGWRKK